MESTETESTGDVTAVLITACVVGGIITLALMYCLWSCFCHPTRRIKTPKCCTYFYCCPQITDQGQHDQDQDGPEVNQNRQNYLHFLRWPLVKLQDLWSKCRHKHRGQPEQKWVTQPYPTQKWIPNDCQQETHPANTHSQGIPIPDCPGLPQVQSKGEYDCQPAVNPYNVVF